MLTKQEHATLFPFGDKVPVKFFLTKTPSALSTIALLSLSKPESPSKAPYIYVGQAPSGVPKTNVGVDPHPAVIHDARGKEDTLNLDNNGFQFVKHLSVEKDFVDEERIKTAYYAEVEQILKKYTGGKRVFIFDHTIRRSSECQSVNSKADVRGPALFVHVDQTPPASEQRVRRHLGDDAERLLKGRYRIINLWRPIENTVAHHPLAVADWRSVDKDSDFVSTRLIYPDREGATYSVKYNPGHRWYYLSDQTPEEVTLIKCFDSAVDKARSTPQSAF